MPFPARPSISAAPTTHHSCPQGTSVKSAAAVASAQHPAIGLTVCGQAVGGMQAGLRGWVEQDIKASRGEVCLEMAGACSGAFQGDRA